MLDALRNLFGDLSPRTIVVNLLDVGLVYFLIYRVLLTIKGTRAAQMVVGIVLIGASFYAAERLEMRTISWLLDNFINYFIIIVIVVFQRDIRRALMRIGQNVVGFGRTSQAHAVDEVVGAAEHLAKARIGGIVVFERDAELRDFVDAGRPVDARVSRALLVALFVPSRDNELHDGAVIINKGLRIELAGALLPLSRSNQLGDELGTRHRAALGITEETDAVSVVISEERGEISLCFRGSIARDLDADTLRRALQGFFGSGRGVDTAAEAEAAAGLSRAMAAIGSESRPEERSGDGTRPAEARIGSRLPTVRPVEEGGGG